MLIYRNTWVRSTRAFLGNFLEYGERSSLQRLKQKLPICREYIWTISACKHNFERQLPEGNLTLHFDSDRSINAENTVRVAKITEGNQKRTHCREQSDPRIESYHSLI